MTDSGHNAQETFFCLEDNSAFRHSWEDLSWGEDGAEPWLWANPPFKDYARVLGKLLKEKVRLVFLVPYWPKQWWFEPLRAMAERTVFMAETRRCTTGLVRWSHAGSVLGHPAPRY